jgi:hypothetical protein
MNRRIDQLFGQALDEIVPSTWTNLTQDQLNAIKNRFAELLIQECADFLKDKLDDPFAAEQLEEHFGVEE